MFDRTITVYNYRKSEKKWYGSVIVGSTLSNTEASSDYSQAGSSDSVSISIWCDKSKKIRTLNSEKQYVTPFEYQALEDVSESLTFAPETDFIVIDKEMDELEVDDMDYEQGFYHYVNKRYDDVYMIVSTSYYNMLPHFTISGR